MSVVGLSLPSTEVTSYLASQATDPLDSPDFDVEVAFNELCPDESHLSTLPLLQLLLRQRIQECRLQTSLLRAELETVSSADGEAPTAHHAEARVARIQEGIGALLTTLATIKSSSTESQSVVESITRDIRSLDLAKANLESAVVGLRRFGMLVNAFDQLHRVAKARRYREASSALLAVKQLSAHLSDLATSVPRVSTLFKAVQDTQRLLRSTIMDEFQKAFNDGTVRNAKSQFSDACLVIDALGDDARALLLEFYYTHSLREYRRIFSGPTSEAGQLDNLPRRFAWFKRILKASEEDPGAGAGIWPEEWEVGVGLCAQFGEVTRDDLKSVLARNSKSLSVTLLLESISTTTAFEREMGAKYNRSYEEIAAKGKSANVGHGVPIRTVFEQYLGIFVDAQDRTLADMLAAAKASRPSPTTITTALATPEDRPASVIPSSTSLFYFYRETLDRCAQLSTRTPFLDLCAVYQKWLKVYSEDVLSASLIKTVTSERRSFEGRRSEGGEVGVREAEVVCACKVVNTAEYCAETAGQLQERLKEKIWEELKEKVSLEAEQDLFRGNISTAILALLRELELALDPSVTVMMRSPWKDAEYVSTESAYVADMVKVIVCVVDLAKLHLEQKKYVRSFCDKVVGLVMGKLTQTIVRCRPIQPIGAEQIILDLQTLKNCLLILPQLDAESAVPTAYTRYVNKSVGRLDTLLKVVMTLEDPAEDFVRDYLVLIPCQSFSDFQKILDLKGVRRSDQNNLLDVFLARTSVQTDLPDTSFLSSIDLDPDRPQSATTTPTMLPSSIFSGGLSFTTPLAGGGSREQSRSTTPSLVGRGIEGEEGGNKALSDFRRFGAKLGMGLRFTREANRGH